MDSEKALLADCKKSKPAAQKQLYDLFAPKMMVICMRYSKTMPEAEDIIQESFIKVFNNLKNFKGESSLYFWIKRIVINTALNHQRGKLYLFPMVDVNSINHVNEGIALDKFSLNELLSMIQELPDGCRIIFNLYAIEGYSHKEIAKKLELSEGTSKSQYARAKSLLRAKIERAEKINYESAR